MCIKECALKMYIQWWSESNVTVACKTAAYYFFFLLFNIFVFNFYICIALVNIA